MPMKVVILSSSDYERIMQKKEVSVADIMFTVVPDYAFGPAEELVQALAGKGAQGVQEAGRATRKARRGVEPA